MGWTGLALLLCMLAGVVYLVRRPRKDEKRSRDIEPTLFGKDTTQFAPGDDKGTRH